MVGVPQWGGGLIRKLRSCQGAPAASEALILIYSILRATALVRSGSNSAPDEEYFITRLLKNLELNPLFEKLFGSAIFKFFLENALV